MIEDMGSKILRVLPDVFFVRSPDGVWVRNSTGSFFIKGAQSYDLVRSLLSQLDGSRTLDEVCHGLTPERRTALQQKLLGPLLRNGFLFEVRTPAEPTPDWIEEKYRDHVAFLEHYVEQPVERFLQVRSRRVVCLGSGLLLRSLTVALSELGFARVRVSAADSQGDAALLREVVAAAARADERAEWNLEVAPEGTTLRELFDSSAVPPADAVLIATEDAASEEIVEALARLKDDGTAAGVVAAAGGLLLASPLLTEQDWCWECLYRSVVSDTPAAPAPAPAALAAFQLGQRLLCRFAGPPVPEDRLLTSVDCRTLNVRSHTPRRHPDCGRHGGAGEPKPLSFDEPDEALVRPDIPTSHDAEESMSAQNSIIESIQTWTDRLTGPLLTVDEEDLAQLPLSASRCRVRAPGSLPSRPAVETFECRALAPREARNQVVLWALEWLAAETARRGGELEGASFGVGWSAGEAVYRAWAALTRRYTGNGRAVARREVKPQQLAQTPARTFLLNELGDRGRVDLSILLDEAPGGQFTATLNGGGETVGRGVGVDEEQAVDHALADALARLCPAGPDGSSFTAYTAPPANRWGEVLRRITAMIAERWTVVEVGHLLPFLDGRARAVALVLKSGEQGGIV